MCSDEYPTTDSDPETIKMSNSSESQDQAKKGNTADEDLAVAKAIAAAKRKAEHDEESGGHRFVKLSDPTEIECRAAVYR